MLQMAEQPLRIHWQWHSLKDPDPPKEKKLWRLSIPVSMNWDSAKHKFLFIVDHVPTPNLSNRKLLSGHERRILENLIRRAFSLARSRRIGSKHPVQPKDCAWAAVSWSGFVTYDSSATDTQIRTWDDWQRNRMEGIFKNLAPTHVHFFGEYAAWQMYNIGVEHRGWIRDVKVAGKSMKVSANLSFTSTLFIDTRNERTRYYYEPDDANLLGHMASNLSYLFLGYNPYSLAHLTPKYKVVGTRKAFNELMRKLWNAEKFSLDLETDNLTVHHNAIVTLQVAFSSRKAYVVPLKCVGSPWSAKDFRYVYACLRKVFGRKFPQDDWNIPYIIGQNLSFDYRVLQTELGLHTMYYRTWDVMAGEYSLDENLSRLNVHRASTLGVNDEVKHKPWALDALLARYGNDFYYEDRFSKSRSPSIAKSEITDTILQYCAMDVQAPFAIHDMQIRQADLDGGREGFYKRMLGIWSDTTHVISQFIRMGTHMDREYVVKQYGSDTSDIEKERSKLLRKLYKCKGVRKANAILVDRLPPHTSLFESTDMDEKWLFDIAKEEHKQLLFLEVLGLEPVSRTAGGKPSLGKDFKQKYASVKEVALWNAMEESVMVRGHVRNYFHKLHDPDGMSDDCVHASYGYLMVVTGRSNSHDPNLQNAPNHGQYAKLVKRAFTARPGHTQVKVDYCTHEVACWCQQSSDETLADVFNRIEKAVREYVASPTEKGFTDLKLMDIHRINYSLFTGTRVEDVTPTQRQSAKNMVFGAIYGEHPSTIAKKLNISGEEMKDIHERFFSKFPKARDWLSDARDFAARNLYVENPLGHRRHLHGYLADIPSVTSAMDRRAMNSPIQGFASQLQFLAARMVHVSAIDMLERKGTLPEAEWSSEHGRYIVDPLPIVISQSIHDSLHTDIRDDYLRKGIRILQHEMSKGLVERTKAMYGIDWIIRPRLDFEIGVTGDALHAWDGTKRNLKELTAKPA